jgi:hypothetical protein
MPHVWRRLGAVLEGVAVTIGTGVGKSTRPTQVSSSQVSPTQVSVQPKQDHRHPNHVFTTEDRKTGGFSRSQRLSSEQRRHIARLGGLAKARNRLD